MIIESGLVTPDPATLIVGTLFVAVLIHAAIRAACYLKLRRRWR